MYGLNNLKLQLRVTEHAVDCPVTGCVVVVPRQRRVFYRNPDFYCPEHKIYISPTTFEYQDFFDNILWATASDRQLLKAILQTKRESRMARNNSEDALTWNVFRHLESNDHLDGYLTHSLGQPIKKSKIIYWGYSPSEGCVYELLTQASHEFGEQTNRGSEPDMIVVSDTHLIFIEAKFTASNNTTPSNPDRSHGYRSGGDSWFDQVFNVDFHTIAVDKRKYELMRFWLLGTWMADQLGVGFHLCNLVLEKREPAIDKEFKPLIQHHPGHNFSRQTWEGIYHFLMTESQQDKNTQKLKLYFKNLTMGYDHRHRLIPALNLKSYS